MKSIKYKLPSFTKKPKPKSKSISKSNSNSKSKSKPKSTSKSTSKSKSKSKKSPSTSTRQTTIKKTSLSLTNPITDKPYSKKYWQIQEKIKNYPANQPDKVKELWDLLDHHDIILLTGETGSGKSTMVPKHVWEYLDYNSTVICTQPTAFSARSIATYVAETMDLEIGNHIWFSHKGSEEYEGGKQTLGINKLIYITDGSFLNDMLKNPASICTFGAILIDEAHVRNTSIDLLMYFIKLALQIPLCKTKFIIMSATIEKEIFMDYYKDYDIAEIHISGRTFPVDVKYEQKSLNFQTLPDMAIPGIIGNACAKKILSFYGKDNTPPKGDILIFVPTIKLTQLVALVIKNVLENKHKKNFRVMSLWAAAPMEDQEAAKTPIKGVTKIIVTTNVAETGITIDGVYYVVDTGLVQRAYFDRINRVNHLDKNFISKAEAKQRTGRAGRTQPGICYRLYTEKEFDGFMKSREYEIDTANLDRFMITLFEWKNNIHSKNIITEVKKVVNQLISPPKEADFNATVNHLKKLALLDSKNEWRLSELGRCVTGLNFESLELCILYLTLFAYDIDYFIIRDIISILAMEGGRGNWFQKRLPDEFVDHYVNPFGDLFGIYHIYLDLEDNQLPDEYMEFINLEEFKNLKKESDKLGDHAYLTKSYICINTIENKYEIQDDIYNNIVSAIKQVYTDNVIDKSILDVARIMKKRVSFYDLWGENKKVIYLNHIIISSFGENENSIHSNYVKY